MRAAILGGGLAGLAAGYFLKKKGRDFVVFEAQDDVGGLERSFTRDGFVFDTGGGHILFSDDRNVLAALLDVVGRDQLQANRRDARVLFRGRYVKYPFMNGLAGLPLRDRLPCVAGYVRAHAARRRGAAEPANFRDWIPWRFGRGVADAFMLPYNEKLWKTDLAAMDPAWTFGRVPEAGLGDVVKAAFGLSSDGYAHQKDFFYPLKGGFQSVPKAFAAPIAAHVRLNTPVTEVRGGPAAWRVNGEAFDRVISTVPLEVLAGMLDGTPNEVRTAAGRLRYCGLATVLIGLDQPRSLPYSWVYLPHAEHGPCHRVTALSNYSPHNAPAGKSSLLAEVTFPSGETPAVDEAFAARVAGSLAAAGMFRPDRVCHLSWWFHPRAYLVHQLDSARNAAAVLRFLEARGIDAVGRFGAFRYANTDHVLADVMRLIEARF